MLDEDSIRAWAKAKQQADEQAEAAVRGLGRALLPCILALNKIDGNRALEVDDDAHLRIIAAKARGLADEVSAWREDHGG